MCTCLLVLQVRSGTPQDHEMRHPGDPNYKNVKAVDLAVRTAGQAVYAVESGECQAAEHPLCQLWQTLPCTISLHYPGGYRVLELTAGLKVISIACTPDLRDWGTLLGPLGTLMSPRLAG
jgi:hypothetical protein